MQVAWQQFLMTLMFFTRLPVARLVTHDPALMPGTARYFTLAGWVVGLLAAGFLWIAAQCLPWWPAILLATAASILLTGAFHEDGFADLCDAFGGGWEKEQVLRIMKDSRLGTYGTLGLGLMVGTKLSLLASLPVASACAALLAGHVLSRTMATSLLRTLDYVRDAADEALIKTPAYTLSPADWWFSLGTAVPALLLLPLPAALAVLPALWLLHVWLTAWYRRRIGGYTGDCLGAAQQMGEITVLLLAVLALH